MKLFLMYFLFNLLQRSKGFTPKEYMVELNDTNFDEKIKMFDSAIVVYYTNHDNLLQFLESDNEIDLSNDEPIYFVYVDCNKSGKHICMKYGISDSLDIKIFHNGIRSSHYKGKNVIFSIKMSRNHSFINNIDFIRVPISLICLLQFCLSRIYFLV